MLNKEDRVLYEAYSDIETIISSDADVDNWNFDFVPNSSRSFTFKLAVMLLEKMVTVV